MKAPLLRLTLLSVGLATTALAAEETTPPKPATEAKPATEEMIRARLLEHTKTKAAPPKPTAPPAPPLVAKTDAPVSPAPVASPEKADPAKTRAEPAEVLPKVQVNKSRITVLDHQLQEQDREIAHEKTHTKPTDLDKALNNPKISISILGGESTKYRTTIASERVSLMESEKDIIEAIAHAKTKEEKAELQKELTEIKAMRRDLEKSVR